MQSTLNGVGERLFSAQSNNDEPESLIALKRGGMPLISDIRFDPIPFYYLIQFRARMDVKLRFFPVGIFDLIVFAIYMHQRTIDRVLGNALPDE